MKPRTYDMTFCVSKCKNKCERHYSQYEFEKGRLYSMSSFDCENKGKVKKIILERSDTNENRKRFKRKSTDISR